MLHIWIVASFHFIAVLSYNYIKDVYGETYWVAITWNIETMTGVRMNFWIMYFEFRITGIIVIGSWYYFSSFILHFFSAFSTEVFFWSIDVWIRLTAGMQD